MTHNPFRESAGTIAAKILMLRAASNKTIVVVEGKHDAIAFANVTDPTVCVLIVAWGKENALAALRLACAKHTTGTLCIVDRDFDFIRNQANEDPNVVYTDFHDLDVMFFCSPALEKMLRETSSPEKLENLTEAGNDLRTVVLSAAAPVARLRLHSLDERLNLTFDDMSFDFVNTSDLSYSTKKMVEEVLKRSRLPKSLADKLTKNIAAQLDVDLRELCVGEDVLQVLTRALYKMIGSQKPSKLGWREVQTRLRLSYEREFFRLSGLYARIKAWEATNPSYRCLPV